jgi:hypothetical protein
MSNAKQCIKPLSLKNSRFSTQCKPTWIQSVSKNLQRKLCLMSFLKFEKKTQLFLKCLINGFFYFILCCLEIFFFIKTVLNQQRRIGITIPKRLN